MNIRRLVAFVICLALLICVLSSCDSEPVIPEPQKQARSFYEYFDTVSVIISYKGDSAEEFDANCQAVSALLDDYHKLFDIYNEYSGINNLKTVNKNAGISPVEVDERLIEFLLYTKEIYKLTNGATNIAMGSVLSLWHDEREKATYNPKEAKLPSLEALEEAAKHVNIENLVINEEARTVYISDPDMKLDVGAIGKGYATEKAAELLIERGVDAYVLNFGGNIRAIGEKVTGEGWKTEITNPDKTSEKNYACKVNIKNTSLVTSGDYERYFIVDNVKYHHIIDPKTNMPAQYFSSISVFCENSALADALSTALFCMNYNDGYSLIQEIGGIEVIWIKADGSIISTDGVNFCD